MAPANSGSPSPLTSGRALVLGTLHGPAELLPVSSSAHVTVVPHLLGWDDYLAAEPELRKAFEVALHAGTALALLVGLRDEVAVSVTVADAVWLGVAALPAAAVGLALEKPIERRLGTPGTISIGMVAGALALAWADHPREGPGDGGGGGGRPWTDAGLRDAVWLGLAQACALMPGVSRNGATLTAARRRGFARVDANRLSRRVGLPVIGGAAGLKAVRLVRSGLPAGMAVPFALGAGAAFVSALLSIRALRAVERDAPLAAFAVYRLLVAGAVLRSAVRGSG